MTLRKYLRKPNSRWAVAREINPKITPVPIGPVVIAWTRTKWGAKSILASANRVCDNDYRIMSRAEVDAKWDIADRKFQEELENMRSQP